uniref:Large proline-rich protein BAG6 n=1 Tax=Arion vulgaris TaxID=1028688 RepID=A0A0B7AYW2_9EUPU
MALELGQSALIDITVKTLDGQNRTFNVPENLNVRQFKENISSSIEIPADNQRLIFQGRVMQDEKVLKDYDIHGKVIHLVQRAPPTTTSGASNSTPTTASTPSAGRHHVPVDGNLFDVQIHLGRVQSTPNTREARARIRQADFNLRLANDVLNQQRLGSLSGESSGRSTSELPQPRSNQDSASTNNQSEDSMDTSSGHEATDRTSQTETRDQTEEQPRGGADSAGLIGDQRVGLMATDLANFLDQVLSTSDRVTSHIRLYRDLLRNEVTYPALSRDGQDAQEIASRATEVFHALSHVLHCLSDVVVDMSTDIPRQAVATPPVQFPIPGTASMAIPIHMNVRARQNSNGQRQGQPTSTASSTTGNTSTASTTTSSSSPSGGIATTSIASSLNAGPIIGPFQTPPVSLPYPSNMTTSADPTVMVEVFPSVTVHDIRAMVTHGGQGDDSNSSTDSADNIGVNRANITTTPSTNIGQPTSTTTPATATTATSEPPPASAARITIAGTFPSATNSPPAFIFGPSASVSFREMPNFGMGQMPNVPGLPPGMLQNILGSILNSHGVRPDQPVQVNVVQQLSATGTPTAQPQQPTQDPPLDSDRGTPPNRAHDNLRQQQPTSQNLPWMPSRTSSTRQNPPSTDTSTGARGNTTAPTSISSNASAFPLSFNWSNLGSQSISIGTATDPSTNTTSQSTNTSRPQFHFHRGPPGQPRPQNVHARPQVPGALRPPGLNSRAYVDPYLPCSSTHYTSQTAQAAFNAMQVQMRERGQPPQQQVPNLSTMVSGMVGEIIEQAGQAAANSGTRTNSSIFTTSVPSTTTSTTTGSGGNQRPPPLNPLEMFSHLLGGSETGTHIGPVAFNVGGTPYNVGAIISNIMQASRTPAGGATSETPAATREATAVPPTWTLADLFTHVRPATEVGAGDENVIISLLEAVAPHMGLTDLFSLVMGNTRVLNQVRGPLLEYVRRQVVHYGSVEEMVEAALNDMYSEIEYLQSLVELRDGMDLAQSLRNCLRVHLTAIFTAIHSDSAGPQGDFGGYLYSLWMKMLADSIGLCIYCIRDGQVGFSNMVQNYMPRMTQGMSPAITIWMTTSLQDILESFYHNHPVNESEIINYIVKQKERPAASSLREQSHSESEASSRSVPSRHTHSTTKTQGAPVSLSGTSSPGPMDIAESPSPQPPRAKMPRTLPDDDTEGPEIFEDAQESFTSRAPPPRTRPNMIATRTEETVGGSRDIRNGRSSGDWQAVIPQDWIPVISRDIVRQQTQRPQPPVSDAYLQGLPAKRRRMMTLEHAGEMGNMPLYLPASLTRAARAADVEPISSEENMAQEAADDLDLQAELEREVSRVLASRMTSDQDFSSERFPNAEEYFHKSSHR